MILHLQHTKFQEMSILVFNPHIYSLEGHPKARSLYLETRHCKPMYIIVIIKVLIIFLCAPSTSLYPCSISRGRERFTVYLN